jgi:hypothetical protein
MELRAACRFYETGTVTGHDAPEERLEDVHAERDALRQELSDLRGCCP